MAFQMIVHSPSPTSSTSHQAFTDCTKWDGTSFLTSESSQGVIRSVEGHEDLLSLLRLRLFVTHRDLR